MPPRRIRPIFLREGPGQVGSRRTRIRIAQPAYRPFKLGVTNLLRQDALREDPWWFVKHRRGVRQPRVGADPLEARAVSHDAVRGTLPERIMYKNLLSFRLYEGVDFDFQSSLDGGRMELGGIVADFILLLKKIVIRIQGPTHEQALRAVKDAEQKSILEDMGYWVVDITDQQVYDRMYLEEWTRNLLGFGKYGGAMVDNWVGGNEGDHTIEEDVAGMVLAWVPQVYQTLAQLGVT